MTDDRDPLAAFLDKLVEEGSVVSWERADTGQIAVQWSPEETARRALVSALGEPVKPGPHSAEDGV